LSRALPGPASVLGRAAFPHRPPLRPARVPARARAAQSNRRAVARDALLCWRGLAVLAGEAHDASGLCIRVGRRHLPRRAQLLAAINSAGRA
jgi:hypothetical protein